MDPCECVTLLVQVGHVYLAFSLGLVCMAPASVNSFRRIHRASKPLAQVAAAHGRLAKKNGWSEASFREQG